VRDVRGRSEQPERREAESGDRAELDDVAGRLALQQLVRLRLAGERLPLDASDQLDRDPEQVLGRRFVQPRAAREPRKHDLGCLVHRAAEPGDQRPQHPFHQRDEERPAARHGYDDPMVVTGMLEALLRDSFPDASELAVEDRTGGGDHFQVTIASGRFDGLSLVAQHRLVYEALAEPLADGSIHELRIKTRGIA
jgi:stress-induced morphogen